MLDLLAWVSADFQIGTYIIDPFGSQFFIRLILFYAETTILSSLLPAQPCTFRSVPTRQRDRPVQVLGAPDSLPPVLSQGRAPRFFRSVF